MTRFHACLTKTLQFEGGYSDDPHDPGGPTMAGIIQRVYDAWRDRMGLPRRHVREIERRELDAIYLQNYWQAVHGDELPDGVDLAVFDFGVNSGPGRAIRALQIALGVKPDGHLGAVTLSAAHAADPADVIEKITAERRRFVRQIKHYWRFKNGWERRITAIDAAALRDAGEHENVTIEVPLPLPDPDDQSASQARAPADTVAVAATTTGKRAAVQGGLGLGLGVEGTLQTVERVERLGVAKTIMDHPALLAMIVIGVLLVVNARTDWVHRARKIALGV